MSLKLYSAGLARPAGVVITTQVADITPEMAKRFRRKHKKEWEEYQAVKRAKRAADKLENSRKRAEYRARIDAKKREKAKKAAEKAAAEAVSRQPAEPEQALLADPAMGMARDWEANFDALVDGYFNPRLGDHAAPAVAPAFAPEPQQHLSMPEEELQETQIPLIRAGQGMSVDAWAPWNEPAAAVTAEEGQYDEGSVEEQERRDFVVLFGSRIDFQGADRRNEDLGDDFCY